MEERNYRQDRSGQILGGIFLLFIGAVAIAKQSVADFPVWLFSWQTLLIAIGIFIGLRHGFRGLGWLVPIIIGTVFLVDEILPDLHFKPLGWPMIIIAVGLIMIFGSFRQRRDRWLGRRFQDDTIIGNVETKQGGPDSPPGPETTERIYSQDDYINTTSIFGGVHKVLVSKNFKGGKATNFFGGTDLNLTQSDFNGMIELELVQIFGGTKLTVPPNWQIKSEMVAVFGGVEDKRPSQILKPDPNKVVVIKGTTIFGGLEINTY